MKASIQYGHTTIDFHIAYVERKTLGIRVHPDMRIEVLAPLDAPQSKILEKVHSKAAWILKQRDFFLSFRPLTPPRRFVSGETHLYLGKQYRLKLVEADEEKVKMQGGFITVFCKDVSDKTRVEKFLKNWYKAKAIVYFKRLFEDMQPRIYSFYNGEVELKYRWMEKRWGSCNHRGEITLNLELIKAPRACIEYVLLHECCHLAHLNHSSSFYRLLEELCPDWRAVKSRLEHFMV